MFPRAIQRWCAANSSLEHEVQRFQEILVVIDIYAQMLILFRHSIEQVSYPVSTSRHGTGEVENSFCTPLGLHEIAEKIGAGRAPGEVFVARQPQGRIFDNRDQGSDLDVITSRILWLQGLQEGYNCGGQCDSYRRYIYIHGTADERRIGRPASLGCIRLNNDDVIDLFARVEVGCRVLIYP